jgi:hypothetical protein
MMRGREVQGDRVYLLRRDRSLIPASSPSTPGPLRARIANPDDRSPEPVQKRSNSGTIFFKESLFLTIRAKRIDFHGSKKTLTGAIGRQNREGRGVAQSRGKESLFWARDE